MAKSIWGSATGSDEIKYRDKGPMSGSGSIISILPLDQQDNYMKEVADPRCKKYAAINSEPAPLHSLQTAKG